MSKSLSPGPAAPAARPAGEHDVGLIKTVEDALRVIRDACKRGIRSSMADQEDDTQSVCVRVLEQADRDGTDFVTLVQSPGFGELVRKSVVARRSLVRRWARKAARLRDEGRARKAATDGPGTVDEADYAAWLIGRAKMSKTERAFAALHLVECRDPRAAAELLGVPEDCVARLKHRTLAKLRRIIDALIQ